MKKKTLLLAAACTLVLTACGTSTANIEDESGVTGTTQVQETETTADDTTAGTANATAESTASTGTLVITEVPTGGEAQVEPSAETFYSAATTIPASQVESYALDIKDMILNGDWETFVNEISYPLIVDGLTMEDATDLTDYIADSKVSADFLTAIEAETCIEMFNSEQGITMGVDGQIWLGAVQNTEGEMELKVIEINSMFEE